MSSAPNTHLKSRLRAAALARRDALSAEQRAAAAQAVAVRTLPYDITPGQTVSGFWPIASELDPRPLMRVLEHRGARLALPGIASRGQPLIFRVWTADAPMMSGQFGILEPSPHAEAVEPDIVLVPLAAFDRAGHRIGYGGGFYDRTLAQLRAKKPIVAIGLAFAVQEIDHVPAFAHDAPLDVVLTESEIMDFRS